MISPKLDETLALHIARNRGTLSAAVILREFRAGVELSLKRRSLINVGLSSPCLQEESRTDIGVEFLATKRQRSIAHFGDPITNYSNAGLHVWPSGSCLRRWSLGGIPSWTTLGSATAIVTVTDSGAFMFYGMVEKRDHSALISVPFTFERYSFSPNQESCENADDTG